MLRILDDLENDCCGCGACFNVCPKHAIKMSVSSEGFLYPEIDDDLCIKCGLCQKSCPVKNFKQLVFDEALCFAVQAPDELRAGSSSGGVFPVLARYIIQKGGIVCGAAFDDNWSVSHILIDKIEDIHKLQKSKYVQSDTQKVFTDIKFILEKKRLVLFVGTPCQSAALQSFLQIKYDNLYCVDFICHGVPSPLVFKRYLREIGLDGKITSLDFRSKAKGWGPYPLMHIGMTEEDYYAPADQDCYMKIFLKNLAMRKSCAACKFKYARHSDLTIGDFWGIYRYNKHYNDNKGTSVVLVNNNHGKQLLDSVKEYFCLYREVPIEVCKSANSNLFSSEKLHPQRDLFFKRLSSYSLNDNVDYCLQNKTDVIICNFWHGYGKNFGAILTAFALQFLLKTLGYSSRIMVHPKPEEYEHSTLKSFGDKYLQLTRVYNKDELRLLNDLADVFICGSDQVWRYNRDIIDNRYFFPFIDTNKKKIAVAASFGTEAYGGTETERQIVKHYIQQFSAVSVREDDGVRICQDEFGVHAFHILDPVFLIDKKIYEDIAVICGNVVNKKYIAAYVLSRDSETQKAIDFASEQLGLAVEYIDNNNGCSCTVEYWLSKILQCQLLITDSYHGACFALIFNKPFVVLNINRDNATSRFSSLLRLFNLEGQALPHPERICTDMLKPFDYSTVNSKLESLRQESIKWIEAAMKLPVRKVDDRDKLINALLSRSDEHFMAMDAKFTPYRMYIEEQIKKDLRKKEKHYRFMSKLTFGKIKQNYKRKLREIRMRLSGNK